MAQTFLKMRGFKELLLKTAHLRIIKGWVNNRGQSLGVRGSLTEEFVFRLSFIFKNHDLTCKLIYYVFQ